MFPAARDSHERPPKSFRMAAQMILINDRLAVEIDKQTIHPDGMQLLRVVEIHGCDCERDGILDGVFAVFEKKKT